MEVSEILTHIGKAVIRGLKAQIVRNGSSSSGNLVDNIYEDVSKDNVLSISMPQYAVYVDGGTKPHIPPVDKIERWANSKGLNAWGVAINISKYGTKAKPFLYRYDEIIKEMEPFLIKEYGININNYVYPKLKNMFKIKK